MQYQLIIFILNFFLLFLYFSIPQILAEWKIPTPISSNNFLDYVNPDVGYNIKYPENWNKLELKSNTTFYPSLTEQKLIKEHPPSVYLNIANTSLPKIPLTLEAIVLETIYNLNASHTDFKLIESNPVLLNKGNDKYAHKLVYSYLESNNTINTMDIGLIANHTIANSNLILLSFVSSPDKYHIYLPTIEKMIETFETTSDNDVQIFLNRLLNPVFINASALGDDHANLTIIEFADYQCPLCVKFHNETRDSVIANFVDTGKAKFLYKDLIVNDGRDKASTLAATASYCAAEQGMYWEYHDELFKNSKGENTGWVTKNNLNQFANKIRVPDLMKFSDCVDTGKYNQIVSENDSFARNIGITSTPSFVFYNGTTPVAIRGAQPYEAFEQIITAIE